MYVFTAGSNGTPQSRACSWASKADAAHGDSSDFQLLLLSQSHGCGKNQFFTSPILVAAQGSCPCCPAPVIPLRTWSQAFWALVRYLSCCTATVPSQVRLFFKSLHLLPLNISMNVYKSYSRMKTPCPPLSSHTTSSSHPWISSPYCSFSQRFPLLPRPHLYPSTGHFHAWSLSPTIHQSMKLNKINVMPLGLDHCLVIDGLDFTAALFFVLYCNFPGAWTLFLSVQHAEYRWTLGFEKPHQHHFWQNAAVASVTDLASAVLCNKLQGGVVNL